MKPERAGKTPTMAETCLGVGAGSGRERESSMSQFTTSFPEEKGNLMMQRAALMEGSSIGHGTIEGNVRDNTCLWINQ